MSRPKYILLLLSAQVFVIGLFAQNAAASLLWNDPAVTQTFETYFMHDTASSRMKISWVRMSATNDTMNAGVTAHTVGDPNCKSCKLIRFASLGEPVYVFDNSFAEDNYMYKTQNIFNQQLKVEREINYMKDAGNEMDTAYHMKGFTLTTYYTGFSISNTYRGHTYSAKPSFAADLVETTTYNTDGTIKWKRTKAPSIADYCDSIIYSYPDKNSSVEKYYHNTILQWTITRKFDESTHQLISETTEALNDEYKPYTYTVNYTYDNRHRLISVSNTLSKDKSYVRYNANNLPEMVVVYTGGQMQAVVFYYSYYQ